MRHRPIGIGVQGLADALVRLRLPYESQEARTLNKDIFETIYYGAMEASIEIARELGPYETYEGAWRRLPRRASRESLSRRASRDARA